MGGLDVAGLQTAKLLPSQRGIVGQRKHTAIADPLLSGLVEQSTPLLVGWEPRKALATSKQAALALAGEALAGGVPTPTHGIGVSLSLLDEEVEEESDRREALLHRGVGQPGT